MAETVPVRHARPGPARPGPPAWPQPALYMVDREVIARTRLVSDSSLLMALWAKYGTLPLVNILDRVGDEVGDESRRGPMPERDEVRSTESRSGCAGPSLAGGPFLGTATNRWVADRSPRGSARVYPGRVHPVLASPRSTDLGSTSTGPRPRSPTSASVQ